MIEAHVAPTTLGHMQELIDNLRPEDRREVEGISGATAKAALLWSYRYSSLCRTILVEGEVAGVFGVCDTVVDEVGSPWLVTTPKILKISRRFLRESRTHLAHLRSVGNYKKLRNVADKRNAVHIRWLEWLGAKFYGDPVKTHYIRFEL